MRKTILMVVTVAMMFGGFADIKVSDVQVFSGYPWKEVVVRYTITGSDANVDFIRLTATDKTANKNYVVESGSSALTGAELSEGRHLLRWNAASEGVEFSSTNVAFAVSAVAYGRVQLWSNGPYWAECNVGAKKPEECGYYFWWGGTLGYKRADSRWDAVDGSKGGFSFSDENCRTYNKDISTLRSQGYIDSNGSLAANYDAATKYLGASWRMPTDAEWVALMNNCTTTWIEHNGVYGALVTGKGDYALKSIFLPGVGYGLGANSNFSVSGGGYYWSSTPNSDNSIGAWCVSFVSLYGSYYFSRENGGRYCGRSVRPVRKFAQ